jgi:class 3 adenylate cyclase
MKDIAKEQLPKRFRDIIDEQVKIHQKGRSITAVNSIPDTSKIPIEKPRHWLKIPDVICVFVDMMNSTGLSASLHDNSTAGAYQLYTGTAVKLFSEFNAPYIDVRGDGVLALFNKDQPYTALAAAVTFKTFANVIFVQTIREKTPVEIGSHIGIDQKTVLVRKIVSFQKIGGGSYLLP